MRKAKSGELAAMEVQQSSVGVRTRAKTLALQRFDKFDTSSYLELRSRKLEKPVSLVKPTEFVKESPNSKLKDSAVISESGFDEEEVQVSFADNLIDFEPRGVRETTPCSLIRNSDSLRTPESTTRRTSSTNTSIRLQNSVNRSIPTTNEMEDFFSCAERLQQSIFTEKYNYDPVNDCPLPGRYEWVKVE